MGQRAPHRADLQRRHWRRVQRLSGGLLLVWLLVTLVGPWFARDLAGWRVFGFPLSFWVASQGALLIYLVIIGVYALAMDRLDAVYQQELGDSEAAPHG